MITRDSEGGNAFDQRTEVGGLGSFSSLTRLELVGFSSMPPMLLLSIVSGLLSSSLH